MRFAPIFLLLAASADAAEFKPFDYQKEPSNLVIAITQLENAKPAFAQRKPEGVESNQSVSIEPGHDVLDFNARGITAWFEYQYSTKARLLNWDPVNLDKHITSYKWFAQATMQDGIKPYTRNQAQGVYRLFTYKPPQGERWCVAGTFAQSPPHNAERITAIVCRPPNSSLTLEEGKKILDAVGTKAMGAVAASAL